MRRRARVDANHASIVQALRSTGWVVVDTSRLGNGFPDVLAARRGVVRLVEIKDGEKPPSARALTAAERQLHDALELADVRVQVVSSIEEALAL